MVASLSYLTPFASLFMIYIILGEKIYPLQLLGLFFIIVSAVLQNDALMNMLKKIKKKEPLNPHHI